MKNIFKYSMLLVAATMMLASCSDDRDSNPTLKTPDSFVLNTPAYASQAIDLYNSETVNLTWSQPDYGGFPVAASYTVELSGTNDWTISNVEANADESGETVPTYYIVENSYPTCEASIDAKDINKALIVMMGYTENNVPATQKLYARVKANAVGANEVVSNVVELLVSPFYIELKPADPVLWYMVGNCIGSSDWNVNDGVGVGLIPLLPEPGADFDKDGNGSLVYAGYFPAGGQFKFIKNPGSWDDQMNFTNIDSNEAGVTDEDGDNHNIGIPEDGYYKITMNTVKNTISIVKLDGTYTEHTTITMPGGYNDWNAAEGNPMTAMGKRENTQTHDWYLDVTYSENTELKFANGSWDVNWGATDFPLGIGTNGGPNIPVKAGTYRVYFNDILGLYYFQATE